MTVKIKEDVLMAMLKDKLKDTIREELRQEMSQPIDQTKPWEKVRDHIEGKLNGTMRRWDTYKIQNAIYIIIRYALSISRVTDLREEQVNQAIEISDACIEMISFPEVSEI